MAYNAPKGHDYGLTHVGRVRRLDGQAIAFEAVPKLLEQLHWWLSLIRGERTGPLLVMGVHQGQVIWESWEAPSVARWRGRYSWLPQHAGALGPVSVDPTLQVLHDAWDNDDSRRALRRAIDWYTQSVSTAHSATRVILAQAGLELMCWLRLVRLAGMSEEGFSQMKTADKLRVTLSLADIPLGTPGTAPELFAAAQVPPILDGPGVVTELRNGVVHPKPQGRFGEVLSAHQGAQLATRYLELLLLQRLGYKGYAHDRVHWGDAEPVPWA